MPIYRPRLMEPGRNAWQETSDQLFNIGGLITGNTRQRKADERQAEIDARDEGRWNQQVAWRDEDTANQLAERDFERGTQGWLSPERSQSTDLHDDFTASREGLETAAEDPFNIAPDPAVSLPGIGNVVRESQRANRPTAGGYRYHEEGDVGRQQTLADQQSALEAAIAAEERGHDRNLEVEGVRHENNLTTRQSPYFVPPPPGERAEVGLRRQAEGVASMLALQGKSAQEIVGELSAFDLPPGEVQGIVATAIYDQREHTSRFPSFDPLTDDELIEPPDLSSVTSPWRGRIAGAGAGAFGGGMVGGPVGAVMGAGAGFMAGPKVAEVFGGGGGAGADDPAAPSTATDREIQQLLDMGYTMEEITQELGLR